MNALEGSDSGLYEKDGRSWHVGSQEDVRWIQEGVTRDARITGAIPATFEAYVSIALCKGVVDNRTPTDPDSAVLDVLRAHTNPQPWWLGYLETGASDVVFDEAPRVQLYWGWRYVLVLAGPEQATSWNREGMWNWSLPALMFPEDCSWLVSVLWDDDWVCVGGSNELIAKLHEHPTLASATYRRSPEDPDAAPPGLRA
jgi:hypothetical protein